MLGRKYTFESKRTRIHRLLISGGSVFALIVALLASFIAYIPIYAKMEKNRTDDAFFQKSPDAITVFTGDKGRIPYALKLLKTYPNAKVLISGVYAANSFETLLKKQEVDATIETDQDVAGMQVDLDYESKNTFGNVRETVQYLKVNPDLKKILIVSSDYHIMRVKLIISHFMEDHKAEFYFDSVTNDYGQWKNIKKLLKESLKLARTFVQLKILRSDAISEED